MIWLLNYGLAREVFAAAGPGGLASTVLGTGAGPTGKPELVEVVEGKGQGLTCRLARRIPTDGGVCVGQEG